MILHFEFKVLGFILLSSNKSKIYYSSKILKINVEMVIFFRFLLRDSPTMHTIHLRNEN